MSEKNLNFILQSSKYNEALNKYDKKFNEAIFKIVSIVSKISICLSIINSLYNYTMKNKTGDYGFDSLI